MEEYFWVEGEWGLSECGEQLLSAEQNTKAAGFSLAQALPSLKQAMGLSLPCREMCEAVFSSCDCGTVHTYEFGQLMTGKAWVGPFYNLPFYNLRALSTVAG